MRILYFRINFFRYVIDDYKHLFLRYTDKRKNRLLSGITKEYHRIEKGLSHKYFRIGFGQRALSELVRYLSKYNNAGYNKNNTRIKIALSVLDKYIERHKNQKIDFKSIDLIFKKYNYISSKGKTNEPDLGGVSSYSKDEILKMGRESFNTLAKSRHSVRYFKDEEVSVDEVFDAISIAQKAPSVCNRQGWYVRLIKSKSIIELFRSVHNGFSNESQNLNCLLLVTFRKDSFLYPMERNQGYTDAGLFSMSLLYSLTYKGFATCPLNSNLTRKNERHIRKVLKINADEGLVMFIAVGHYEDNFVTPISYRDHVNDVVKVYL